MIVFRQAAAAALAAALVDFFVHQPQGPPITADHLKLTGLAFCIAFIITEFGDGWHILLRRIKALRRVAEAV